MRPQATLETVMRFFDGIQIVPHQYFGPSSVALSPTETSVCFPMPHKGQANNALHPTAALSSAPALLSIPMFPFRFTRAFGVCG